MLDLDGNGSIDSDEFREVVSLGNMAVSEEELDSLLQRGDLNSDGVIDLAEFKQLLKVSRRLVLSGWLGLLSRLCSLYFRVTLCSAALKTLSLLSTAASVHWAVRP